MPAKYLFYKNPHAPAQGEDDGVLHARVVDGEVLRFDQLCEIIASRSTFNRGEVKGIMILFKEELARALKEGDSVELDGVGTFSVTAKCPPVHSPKEIRAESIRFSKVVFRACKELKKEMDTMSFERATDYRKKVPYTAGQRQERILAYLSDQGGLSSSDCMRLNACSRYIAQLDLKALREAGRIIRLGGPRVALYVLAEKNPKDDSGML